MNAIAVPHQAVSTAQLEQWCRQGVHVQCRRCFGHVRYVEIGPDTWSPTCLCTLRSDVDTAHTLHGGEL